MSCFLVLCSITDQCGFLYGLGVQLLKNKDIENLEKFQRKCLKQIQGLPDNTSNTACLARIRVVSALGRFRLGRFGLGRFDPILGWVFSAKVGGSIRPWVVSALGRFGRSLYQNVDCLGQADKQIDR